jgi:hypothetical protein
MKAALRARQLVEAAIDLRTNAPLDLSCEICTRLLAQAANQLRQVELASEAGYALQALGGGASVYEAIAAIGFVDGDDERGKTWVEHRDVGTSYPGAKYRKAGVRRLLVAGGVKPSDIESQAALWETWYQFFCVGKHLNPVLLSKYGIKEDAERLKNYLGPVSGPEMRTMSRYAIARGSHVLLGGCLLIAKRANNPTATNQAKFGRALSRAITALQPHSAV